MSDRKSVRWEGKGLHTGGFCAAEVTGSDMAGLRFVFSDGGCFRVEEATASGDGRGSTLSFPNGITIRTVEHLFSALAGLGIWNAEIRIEGGEVPALDGSAGDFARGLSVFEGDAAVGKAEPLRIDAPVSVRDPRKGASLVALPAEQFGVTCVIDYPGTWIGVQTFTSERMDRKAYLEEIAPARTFCLESEIEALRTAGLGKGGSLENTLVIGPEGPLNPEGLAWPNGCVRHKVLDLIGDLALLGWPIAAHLIAFRSGHALHLSLVSRLKRILKSPNRETRR
jgi:UDP-3-O-[3-hydroxymyristoyl] N-acetylglucosamine deacetylase